jgi:hypothetical protein
VGSLASDLGESIGCAWGDYDNDGYLDLFVATAIGTKVLYHNNTDGSFTRIVSGSLVNDLGTSLGCAWADYDNDGFLDLFVANGGENNALYHNNGNGNAWLEVKCVGTVSNRSAIGAKVRVKATIRGNTFWQMREISGGSGYGSQNELRAHFGLGNARSIELLRVEWPSGIVQTMTNVAVPKRLTVMEHQEPGASSAPHFMSVSPQTNGSVNLSVTGDAGLRYLLEASTNLVNWTSLGVSTNLAGSIEFTDTRATNYFRRFYRVFIP